LRVKNSHDERKPTDHQQQETANAKYDEPQCDPSLVNHFRQLAFVGHMADSLRMCHGFGFDHGVKLVAGQEAELDRGFAEAGVFMVGGFGDFGGVVVADLGG